MKTIIPRSFYARDTIQVARDLLGCTLVRQLDGNIIAGIITETEGYAAQDPACHAFRGKTKRNAALFGPVGHTYLYFTYGMHYCLNIVARTPHQQAGGVLIRAIKPIEGLPIIQKYRGAVAAKKLANLTDLTNGPAKIAQALQLTTAHIGIDVTQQGALYILHPDLLSIADKEIIATPRIGISVGKELLWRFVLQK